MGPGLVAIALEGAGPVHRAQPGLATEGNLWRLGVLVVAVGLLGLPWSFAGSLFALANSLPAALAIGVVGTLLFGPGAHRRARLRRSHRPAARDHPPPLAEPEPDAATRIPPAVEPLPGAGEPAAAIAR